MVSKLYIIPYMQNNLIMQMHIDLTNCSMNGGKRFKIACREILKCNSKVYWTGTAEVAAIGQSFHFQKSKRSQFN